VSQVAILARVTVEEGKTEEYVARAPRDLTVFDGGGSGFCRRLACLGACQGLEVSPMVKAQVRETMPPAWALLAGGLLGTARA